MAKYECNESYKHKLAKELLFSWLIDEEKEEDFRSIFPPSWRFNEYGIHVESPFYDDGNGQFLFIPDITIDCKSRPTILIEIIHTSPLSKEKIRRIFSYFSEKPVVVYQIDAENILSQTNKRCDLRFTKIKPEDYLYKKSF